MKKRTIYETEEAWRAQQSLGQDIVSKLSPSFRFQNARRLRTFDGFVYQDDKVFAILEVKIRSHFSKTYPTLLISRAKIDANLKVAIKNNVFFILAILYKDGMFYTLVRNSYPTQKWGRNNPRDKWDIENCYAIPVSEFKSLEEQK